MPVEVVLKFKLSAAGREDFELSTYSALLAAEVLLRPLTFFVLRVISFLLITFMRLFYELELEVSLLFCC